MALYALSDLHLSFSADKPMDIFGSVWHNHTEKIMDGWNSVVSDGDLVIVGGDISWAMYLKDAYEDFAFLNSLSGKKIIMRGNHDYWWESVTKINKFFKKYSFDTVSVLQNNAFIYENYSISGTRGWILPSSDGFGADDRKVYERELIRLGLSLEYAQKLEKEHPEKKYERLVVMHYPPSDISGRADPGFAELFERYGVKRCIYGHLHGSSAHALESFDIAGASCMLVSSDYLGFKPVRLSV